MADFMLHPQLDKDCHVMGRLHGCQLLLHRNGSLPWYILVPQSTATQLHLLSADLRQNLNQAMDCLAAFILSHHGCDHTNVAAIGNRVPQLHLHVVGRWPGDPCWPGVVWGALPPAPDRKAGELDRLSELLTQLPGYARLC